MAQILVIDDEPDVRPTPRDLLAGAGHEVVAASDGRAGLAAQRERPADLVITDIFMPEKEGIDYLGAAGQFGAVRTLAKPIDADAMRALVREVLGG